MDQPTQERIFELFFNVLEVQASEREAKLRSLTSSPEELSLVRELLVSGDCPGSEYAALPHSDEQEAVLTESSHTRTIGSYELLQLLGGGGMGTVYRARHTGSKQVVAIKVLNESIRDNIFLKRFRREAEILQKIEHPNIATLIETNFEAEAPYIVMEYIEGKPLASIIESPANLSDAVRWIQLIIVLCKTLHIAHQSGIVHRDLKPQNVMIDSEGNPILLDFGIAKDLSAIDQTELSLEQEVLGSPKYMSPEQHERSAVDARSDVWALGVMLYECTTGVRPFVGPSNTEIQDQVLNQDFVAATKRNEVLLPGINIVLEKALEKNKNDRYSSALDFATDLESLLNGRPLLAKRRTLLARTYRLCRQHPALTSMAALTTLSLASAVSLLAVHLEDRVRELALKDEKLREQKKTNEHFEALFKLMMSQVNQDGMVSISLPFFEALEEGLRDSESKLLYIKVLIALCDRLDESARDAESLQIAQKALRLCEQLDEQREDLLKLYPIYSVVLVNVGDMTKDVEAKAAFYDQAFEIDKMLIKLDKNNQAHQIKLCYSYERRGGLDMVSRDYPAAKPWFEKQLAQATSLAEQFPESIAAKSALLDAHCQYSDVVGRLKQFELAEFHTLRRMALAKELLKQDPNNFKYQSHSFGANRYLGILHKNQGEFKKALGPFLTAAEEYKALLERNPERTRCAEGYFSSLVQAGSMYIYIHDLPNALITLHQGVDILEQFPRRFPDSVNRPGLLRSMKGSMTDLEEGFPGEVPTESKASWEELKRRVQAMINHE